MKMTRWKKYLKEKHPIVWWHCIQTDTDLMVGLEAIYYVQKIKRGKQ